MRLLHCDAERSAGDADAGNLIVQGDNLKALKALLPFYAGKVKCIYIDPPYNTGNEGWVYNDNVNAPEVKAWLGDVVGKEAEDLSRHDKWLCMMFPRLRLLRDFLTDDGAIFVSIDDNELASLRWLMAEIFGSNNLLTTIAWERSDSPRMDADHFSTRHEYLVAFARKKEKFVTQRLVSDETEIADHYNKVDDAGRRYYLKPLRAMGGQGDTAAARPNLHYPITAPDGTEVLPMKSTSVRGAWRWGKEKVEAEAERLSWSNSRGPWSLSYKIYADQNNQRPPETLWRHDDVGSSRTGKAELKQIFKAAPFDTPKPLALLRRIFAIACGSDSLILDSFAGSGTTMHAAMQLNREDGGTRRCILVEMEEKIATEVTSERIRRVMQQEDARTGGPNKSEGFRYCTLGEPLLDAMGNVREDVTFADLAAHVFFAHTGVPIPQKATDGDPLLGVHAGTAVFLLETGDLLTGDRLDGLATPDGVTTRAVYAEGCRLGEKRLEAAGVTFHQLPYDLSRLHAGAGGGR